MKFRHCIALAVSIVCVGTAPFSSAEEEGSEVTAEEVKQDINPHLKRHSGYRLMLPSVNPTNCSDPELFDRLLMQILQTSGDAAATSANLDRLEKYEESCRKLRKDSRLSYLDAQNKQRLDKQKEENTAKKKLEQHKH